MPADATLDTITVRVPIAFRRRGGRKAVVKLDGSPQVVSARGRFDSALIKALARAFRWRKLIETGVYTSIEDIALAEKINASYVGRVFRLTLLAPDLVEAILNGCQPETLTLDRLMRFFSVVWAKQKTDAAIRATSSDLD